MEIGGGGAYAAVPTGALVRRARVTCLAGEARLDPPATAGLPADLVGVEVGGEVWATVAGVRPSSAYVSAGGTALLLRAPVRWLTDRAPRATLAVSADARAGDNAALTRGEVLLDFPSPKEFFVRPGARLRVRRGALLACTCAPDAEGDWYVLRGECRAWVDPGAEDAAGPEDPEDPEDRGDREEYRTVSFANDILLADDDSE